MLTLSLETMILNPDKLFLTRRTTLWPLIVVAVFVFYGAEGSELTEVGTCLCKLSIVRSHSNLQFFCTYFRVTYVLMCTSPPKVFTTICSLLQRCCDSLLFLYCFFRSILILLTYPFIKVLKSKMSHFKALSASLTVLLRRMYS